MPCIKLIEGLHLELKLPAFSNIASSGNRFDRGIDSFLSIVLPAGLFSEKVIFLFRALKSDMMFCFAIMTAKDF